METENRLVVTGMGSEEFLLSAYRVSVLSVLLKVMRNLSVYLHEIHVCMYYKINISSYYQLFCIYFKPGTILRVSVHPPRHLQSRLTQSQPQSS